MISKAHDPSVLLRKVRLLEVAARRNAGGLAGGDYTTSIPGQGMVFHETRKYVAGESARRIDWNITARVGEPQVRVHLEERQREVVIALDVSPSMHTGFQEKTKLEYAVELAATLAASVVEGGDRLGHVIFADRVIDQTRPEPGRRQLFRVLRSLLEHSGSWTRAVGESDPRAAIHAIQRRRGRFVVFLISDFIDHDVPDDLKYASARHDVSLLHVYDPFEYSSHPAIVFPARSPERLSEVSFESAGSPLALRPGEVGHLAEKEGSLHRAAARRRISLCSCPTDEPVIGALGRFFQLKRRRRVR